MSDSFAGLLASTTPSNPPTLASTSRPTHRFHLHPWPRLTYGKPDLFAANFTFLSLPATTGGSSVLPFVPCTRLRKVHALHVGRATFRIRSIDLRRRTGQRRDVCSDLFAGSTTGTNGTKNMTLATRLNLNKRQQWLNAGWSPNAACGGNRVWVALDTLCGLPMCERHASNAKAEDNDGGFGDFGAGSKPASSRFSHPKTKPMEKLWDLDEFSSTRTTTTATLTPEMTSHPTQPTTKPTTARPLHPLQLPPPPSATTQQTTKTLSTSLTLLFPPSFASHHCTSSTPLFLFVKWHT